MPTAVMVSAYGHAGPGGLLVERMPAGMGRYEDTSMMDLHEPALTDDLNGLTGQP
jgi:hypothetical protein